MFALVITSDCIWYTKVLLQKYFNNAFDTLTELF